MYRIRRRIKTIIVDPRATLSWFLYEWTLDLFKNYFYFLASLRAWLWNVNLGKNNRFFGSIVFKKFPRSKIQIGDNCTFRTEFRSNLIGINHPCAISTHKDGAIIEIGDRCGFSGVIIAARRSVKLGNDVLCGANTVITDFDWHGINPMKRSDNEYILSSPIEIGNNVWLGMNVIVLKGVSIGENSVIAAQSVITSSIPANVLAGGVPAKVIRTL